MSEEKKPWFEEFDADTKGYLQNRGWDKLDPAAAANAAITAHRGAEKLIGAPASEMVRLPKDPNDAAAWEAVHRRLGKPAEPTEYVFEGADEKLAEAMRSAAHAAHLTVPAAQAVTSAVSAHLASQKQMQEAAQSFEMTREREALVNNWGPFHATNMEIARRGAEAIGIKPDAVAAMEKSAGYAAVMEAFRQIGVARGEARYLTGENQQPGIMSRDQAQATYNDRMNDAAWVKRYTSGGTGSHEFKELQDLISKGARRGG